MTEASKPREASPDEIAEGIAGGLVALDRAVRMSGHSGPPGSGIYLLLATTARHLGITPPSFPAAQDHPGEDETEQAGASQGRSRR